MTDPPSPPSPRAPLATLMEGDLADAVASHVRDRGVLTQLGGLETGRVLTFDAAPATLGRAPDCTYVFEDASLSRVHARILREGGAFVVEDAGSSNGTFVNDERLPRSLLGDGDRVRLGLVVTLRFQLVDAAEELGLKNVYDSSMKDGLTGAFNRRHLGERLTAEISFAQRHGTPLSLVMFDLDHFKKINDRHGHLAGDEVLRATAARVRAALRGEDVLARYGGEEFVILARGIELANAGRLAERVRAAAEASPVPYGVLSIPTTLSAGVASLSCCGEERTVQKLIAIADERLYAAKNAGRNRVVAS